MTAQQRHSVFDVAGLPRLKEVIGGESWNVAVIHDPQMEQFEPRLLKGDSSSVRQRISAGSQRLADARQRESSRGGM
jgi:hypothetical protein